MYTAHGKINYQHRAGMKDAFFLLIKKVQSNSKVAEG